MYFVCTDSVRGRSTFSTYSLAYKPYVGGGGGCVNTQRTLFTNHENVDI